MAMSVKARISKGILYSQRAYAFDKATCRFMENMLIEFLKIKTLKHLDTLLDIVYNHQSFFTLKLNIMLTNFI